VSGEVVERRRLGGMHDIVCARDADCGLKIRQKRQHVTVVRNPFQYGIYRTQKIPGVSSIQWSYHYCNSYHSSTVHWWDLSCDSVGHDYQPF
jgi:hypothetical protein